MNFAHDAVPEGCAFRFCSDDERPHQGECDEGNRQRRSTFGGKHRRSDERKLGNRKQAKRELDGAKDRQ